ncbi:MAG: hypothetical protein GC179_00845 [Anaerolineaceae bacterium]|nr:hypothetical protein [Anaerolineaceae bacterium]
MATSSHTSAATTLQIVQRRTHVSHPLQLRHFSAISRTSRRHKVSIQRLAPSNPPVISAEVLRIMRNLQ